MLAVWNLICKKITMAPFTSFISVYYLLILKWDPLGYLPCSSLWENDNKNSLKMQSYRIFVFVNNNILHEQMIHKIYYIYMQWRI